MVKAVVLLQTVIKMRLSTGNQIFEFWSYIHLTLQFRLDHTQQKVHQLHKKLSEVKKISIQKPMSNISCQDLEYDFFA